MACNIHDTTQEAHCKGKKQLLIKHHEEVTQLPMNLTKY